MYRNRVGELYISRIGIKFIYRALEPYGSKQLLVDPLTYISELFWATKEEDPTNTRPDFYVEGQYFEETNTFIINYPTKIHKLWVTGIPLEDNPEKYVLINKLKSSIYQDQYRKYLFQISNESNRIH